MTTTGNPEGSCLKMEAVCPSETLVQKALLPRRPTHTSWNLITHTIQSRQATRSLYEQILPREKHPRLHKSRHVYSPFYFVAYAHKYELCGQANFCTVKFSSNTVSWFVFRIYALIHVCTKHIKKLQTSSKSLRFNYGNLLSSNKYVKMRDYELLQSVVTNQIPSSNSGASVNFYEVS